MLINGRRDLDTKVFHEFGVNPDAIIESTAIPQLRRSAISLESWRLDWNESFDVNPNIGNYPKKGVGLVSNPFLYWSSRVAVT